METNAKVRKLHQKAKSVRLSAYAPYSKFKVGAALAGKNGKTFEGCNIENASYGGTVCAERVAILKAVSEGTRVFTDIVVVTEAKRPAYPCALCLQVMAEFFAPETRIWIANGSRVTASHAFKDLLPSPFGPKQLKDAR